VVELASIDGGDAIAATLSAAAAAAIGSAVTFAADLAAA
jgi:hypothetical protein